MNKVISKEGIWNSFFVCVNSKNSTIQTDRHRRGIKYKNLRFPQHEKFPTSLDLPLGQTQQTIKHLYHNSTNTTTDNILFYEGKGQAPIHKELYCGHPHYPKIMTPSLPPSHCF